jgi:hypothetical protein
MEKIIIEFKNNFELLLNDFKIAITNEYDITLDDLNSIWNKLNNINIKKNEKKTIAKSIKIIDKEEDKKPEENIEKMEKMEKIDNKNYCAYILRRGEREGKECGEIIKNKNNIYCTQHKKYEGKEIKDKNIVPTKKSSPVKSSPNPDLILRKIKDTDHIYHPKTMLVFLTKDDKKVVIGKWNKLTKNVDHLSEEDIKICITNKFAYDDNHLKIDNEFEESEEEKLNDFFLQWKFEEKIIEGKISFENLDKMIKPKKIKKSNNFENDGYPIKISINKDDEKLIIEFNDGNNRWSIISLTIKNSEYKYIYDWIDSKSFISNKKKNIDKQTEKEIENKKKDDNILKKSQFKDTSFSEKDNVEDVLEEITKKRKETNSDEVELLDSSDEEDLLDD